jgi:adenylate cyclase
MGAAPNPGATMDGQPFQIRILTREGLAYAKEFTEPVELGRQRSRSETLYEPKQDNGLWRLPLAKVMEQDISRKHVLVEPLADNRVRITNLSDRRIVHVAGCAPLEPGGLPVEHVLPVTICLGERTIEVEGKGSDTDNLHMLRTTTRAPGKIASATGTLTMATLSGAGGLNLEAAIDWLQGVVDLLHEASNEGVLFQKAVEATVRLVGLDSAQLLRYSDGAWSPMASARGMNVESSAVTSPSQRVLNSVHQQKRTCWQLPMQSGSGEGSLSGVQTVVAAPILDPDGGCIGALYGDRRRRSIPMGKDSGAKLEAMLVELLATSVASGLVRISRERDLVAARVRFEEFFGAELAARLEADQDLLQARDADVTILFCDIRNFSRISARLGSSKTLQLIGETLTALSDCVLEHHGVLVDYIGDELMAMWGAPQVQANHAELACRAALEMQKRLPSLSARWRSELNEPIAVGIGINSGPAQVGNTGSQRKFKYGPLGDTVNIASRVQGATKYLKSRLLITQSTHDKLGAELDRRRIGKVRVVNIDQPIELYELSRGDAPSWPVLKEKYETALGHFLKREFPEAARILGPLAMEYRDDGPTLVLLSRAVNHMVQEPAHFDGVFDLPGK